jgi:ADP-ribose pyrophosphatase YjhB (NUDIX family)
MPHIHTLEGQIDFTADVFVVRGNKVLLRIHDKYKIWLAVGGHIELDEDPNDAAIREVKEEVGLDVILFSQESMRDDDDQGYKELVPPRFMNIHQISATHRHISLVYFARSAEGDVVPSGSDVSNDWHWFTKEELETNKYGIRSSIRHYALTALSEAGWDDSPTEL